MNQRDVLLGLLVMAIWGFNFSMIKLGVSHVDPLIATAARFALAVFPLILFIPKPKVAWRYLMAYGVVFGVGVWGIGSCAIAVGVSSGMSSVLLQTNVLFGMLIGVCFYKDVLPMRKRIGAALATIGIVVSIFTAEGNVSTLGVVLMMISAISWALVGVIVKTAQVKQVFAFNIWGLLFAPVPLVALSVTLNGVDVIAASINAWDINTTIGVTFQAYPTTLFGYWVWNQLLLRYPLSTVAPLSLLVTVAALLTGYLMFGETLSYPQMLSCGLFLAGVFLIVGQLPKPPKVVSSAPHALKE